MAKIAFIGLGAMGSRIAKNLIEDGHELIVYNRNSDSANAIAEFGAEIATSPKRAAQQADYIMVMVSDDKASQQVWLDPEQGAIHGMDNSKVALELSTLSLPWSKELSLLMQGHQYGFLEAPVLGSRPQAESRQLVFILSGSEHSYQAAKPILEPLAAKLVFLDHAGQASALKLAVNTLLGVETAALAEMIQALRQAGFHDDMIGQIFPDLAVCSPVMKIQLSLMLNKQYSPLFPIDLVEKDMVYAEQLCLTHNVKSYMSSAAKHVFRDAQNAGYGKTNISGIIQLYQTDHG